MQQNYYLSPLVVAMALAMSTPVKAADAKQLNQATFAEIAQSFQLSLPGSKKAAATLNNNTLQFLTEHRDAKGVTHIRMQQTYAGYPVAGGYAILHSLSDAKNVLLAKAKVSMNGTIFKGLENELGKPNAAFAANATSALEHFKAQFAGNNLSQETVSPMIYIDKNHQAHWAYKVSVLVNVTDGIPQRPTAIIDAQTYKPFVQWDNIKTDVKPRMVSGRGYGGNLKIGFYEFGKRLPLLEISRDDVMQECFMESNTVKVIDMNHKYASTKRAMHFNCANNGDGIYASVYSTGYTGDGYDKQNGAASPSNDAMYAGYVINHMYSDWYDIPALKDEKGQTMKLVMRVHYGVGYENAYWDGEQMTFGDGDTMLYPLVSLGVGAHEISHGFTEQHSNLEYYGQSGGMNESFSDMAAQAAEYYSDGTNSWQIGPEILKEITGMEALRFMDRPSKDGESLDAADEYYDGLDVHYSSGVYNHLFYILANQNDWNVRKAFDVMVKANMDYWTPNSSFNEGGCGVISAAKDLGYSIADVQSSLEQVAIDYSACN